MDHPDAEAPRLPLERPLPAALRTGCIVVVGLSLLPMLYVGTFAVLIVDSQYEGPILRSLDERTLEALELFYWPLIVVYEALK